MSQPLALLQQYQVVVPYNSTIFERLLNQQTQQHYPTVSTKTY